MKVLGQLEGAQLENVGGTSGVKTSTGKVVADVTNPSSAVPYMWNGSAWLPLLATASSAPNQQTTSGSTINVNWATGLFQQVILNSDCAITFSNPQAGQLHTLVVTQRNWDNTGYSTPSPNTYTFNIPDLYTRRQAYKIPVLLQSSESHVYTFYYNAGIKPAYATIPVAAKQPLSLPSGAATSIDLHPTIKIMMLGRSASPYTSSYIYYDGGYSFTYGLQSFATHPTAAAAATGVAYHPDGSSLFVSSGTSPYLQGWIVDPNGIPNSNGVYSNPATLPTGAAQCITVHPSGSYVAVGHATTPFMSMYPLTGVSGTVASSGYFGTKVSNPSSLPSAQVNAIAFSQQGDYIAVGTQSSPYLQVWGFYPTNSQPGPLLSNPGVLPAGGPASGSGKAIAWNPAGTYIAMCMSVSPYIQVFPITRSAGAGTLGNPVGPFATNAPASTCLCVQFSPCGNYLLVGNSSGLFIYDFNTWGTTAPLTFDGSNPGVQVNDIVVHPSGEWYSLAMNASPYIYTGYMPRKVKNYLRLNW